MFKFYFILLLALSTTLAFDKSDKENEVVQKSNTTGHMRKSRVQRTGSGNQSSTSRTEIDKIEAGRAHRRKYQAQFTNKNIEKAKNTLTTEKLNKFLQKAEKHKARRSIYNQKRPKKAKEDKSKKFVQSEQQKGKALKRKLKEVETSQSEQNQPKVARKKLTESQIIMREADIRAANKAALAQL